jgi:NADPH-dependent curcumin reductase CurA
VVEGLEKAPEAVNMLFDGDNRGKLMVRVADVPVAA